MVKKQVEMEKLSLSGLARQADDVAVEETLCIPLEGGEEFVTCTPRDREEMILGRKLLHGDNDRQELRAYRALAEKAVPMARMQAAEIFAAVTEHLEQPGPLFAETGCAHSCVLLYEGRLLCRMEDVGRHNALDKAVGFAVKAGVPLCRCCLLTSGRVSGDYLKKAAQAGLRLVVSRAAVTDKAVALAREKNVTLLGFVRKNAGNLYHRGSVECVV